MHSRFSSGKEVMRSSQTKDSLCVAVSTVPGSWWLYVRGYPRIAGIWDVRDRKPLTLQTLNHCLEGA
jgi:hypothetical protein